MPNLNISPEQPITTVFKTFDDLQVYSPHTYRISTLRDRYPPHPPSLSRCLHKCPHRNCSFISILLMLVSEVKKKHALWVEKHGQFIIMNGVKYKTVHSTLHPFQFFLSNLFVYTIFQVNRCHNFSASQVFIICSLKCS